MLFETNIYGPIKSRRLGNSLGINLMLTRAKICSFDCIYCECGFNTPTGGELLPERREIAIQLEKKLKELVMEGIRIDVITFSGNGEPTMHPEFEGIIEDTIRLRNIFYPTAKVTVLSNSTQLHRPDVIRALLAADNRLMKFDSGMEHTMRLIDQPVSKTFNVEKLTEQLAQFKGNLTIQTIFLRGEHKGEIVDNTTAEEVNTWIEALQVIKPRKVMIYAVDRTTPVEGLVKLTREELEYIAEQARRAGFNVTVSA